MIDSAQTATQNAAGASSAAQESKTPDDRSTTFQPVEGGGENRSGTTLLVEAYVVLWVLLLGWLLLVWRRQAAINARLGDLEQAIDRAAAKGAAKK
ncbi:MAG TPA: CcmD family protein [Polyangiaceae bacterium]|jgi:hypothetical protein